MKIRKALLFSVATVGILLLVLLILVYGIPFWSEQPVLYLALVGPLSGVYAQQGQTIINSVQLYLDQINAAGGIRGKQIQLLVFDDQNNPDRAVVKAKEIAEQSQALVVLGHKLSSTSLPAGEIY